MKCPICGREMQMLVTLYVQAPTSAGKFRKASLRRSDMQIVGAAIPPAAEWYCEEHGTLAGIQRMLRDAKSAPKET